MDEEQQKKKKAIAIGVSVAVAILIILIIIFLIWYSRKKSAKIGSKINIDSSGASEIPITNDF